MDFDGGNGDEVLGREGDDQHDAEDPGHGDVLNRPQPVYSPPLSIPAVDWDNVARLTVVRGNLGLKLPQSTNLPVLACDPGPNHPSSRTYNPMGEKYTPPTELEPFGQIEGFWTNLGPISFPRYPIKGYVWDRDNFWVLNAGPPGFNRRGSRGSRR